MLFIQSTFNNRPTKIRNDIINSIIKFNGYSEQKDHLINQSMNDEGVYRTTTATLGLLNIPPTESIKTARE